MLGPACISKLSFHEMFVGIRCAPSSVDVRRVSVSPTSCLPGRGVPFFALGTSCVLPGVRPVPRTSGSLRLRTILRGSNGLHPAHPTLRTAAAQRHHRRSLAEILSVHQP